MENCPICNSFCKDGITTCECGYDFAKMEIADSNRIQAYIASLSKKSLGPMRSEQRREFMKYRDKDMVLLDMVHVEAGPSRRQPIF